MRELSTNLTTAGIIPKLSMAVVIACQVHRALMMGGTALPGVCCPRLSNQDLANDSADEPRGSASSAWDTPAVVTGWNASESTLNTGVVDWGHTTAEGGDGGDNCDAKKEEVAWYERRIETDFEEMDKLCTCYTEGCEGCGMLFVVL